MYVSYIIIYSIIPMYMYIIVCKPNSVRISYLAVIVLTKRINVWNEKAQIIFAHLSLLFYYICHRNNQTQYIFIIS